MKKGKGNDIKDEILLYLLQRFNDYEVPLTMTPEEVKELLIEFIKEYDIVE